MVLWTASTGEERTPEIRPLISRERTKANDVTGCSRKGRSSTNRDSNTYCHPQRKQKGKALSWDKRRTFVCSVPDHTPCSTHYCIPRLKKRSPNYPLRLPLHLPAKFGASWAEAQGKGTSTKLLSARPSPALVGCLPGSQLTFSSI